MQRTSLGIAQLCVLAIFSAALGLWAAAVYGQTSPQPHNSFDYAKLSLNFEENRGQAAPAVRYFSHGVDGDIAFTRDQVLLPCGEGQEPLALSISASRDTKLQAEQPTGGVVNYYSGQDRRSWIEGIPLEKQVRYLNAADGIDIVFHGEGGRLEYDVEVAPGADPRTAWLAPQPGAMFQIEHDGSVILKSNDSISCVREPLRLLAPNAFQIVEGERHTVRTEFAIDSAGRLGFHVGDYDTRNRLIIDPVVAFTNIFQGGQVIGMQMDAQGDYIILDAATATGFNLTAIDPTGTQVLYSTTIAPSGGAPSATAVALDPLGNAYVVGSTNTLFFPITAQLCSNCDGNGGFVAKFDTTGALVYSTLIGPDGGPYAHAIVVDSSGNAYLAGSSSYAFGLQTVNAFQTTAGTAFFAELNPTGTAFILASYFGGASQSMEANPTAISLDKQGNIYLAGFGNDVPLTHPLQAGVGDSWVAEFAPDGKTLLFSTLLDGTYDNTPIGMQVGADGTIYIAGDADVEGTPYSPTPVKLQLYPAPFQNLYAAAINPARTGFSFFTSLGTGIVTATGLDGNGNFYVGGIFSAGSIPLKNAVTSDIAYGPFIVELGPSGLLLNSTAFGGTFYGLAPSGLRIDSSGNVYTAGSLQPDIYSSTSSFSISDPISVGEALYSNQGLQGGKFYLAKIAPNSEPQVSLSYAPPILELRDAGSADLSISNIQVAGSFAKANSTCGSVLPAGTACYLTPSDTNGNSPTGQGLITIVSDASPSSQTYAPEPWQGYTGLPIGAQLYVDTTQFIFPPTQNGTTSQPRPIKLWNVGTSSTSVSSVIVTGVGAKLQQTNDCGTLAPQSFCTIRASITPPLGGAGITINSSFGSTSLGPTFTENRADGPLLTSISGTHGINFGEVLLGQPSLVRTVTVTNSGVAAIPMVAPVITGNGGSAFSVTADGCSGTTLQPQQSCVIAVSFQPSVAGLSYEIMTFSGGGYSQQVEFEGTGVVAPSVTVSPGSASLGTVQVGATVSQTFQVTNNSVAAVTLSNIVVTPATATLSTEYSEQGTCQNGLSLAVGASCSITITFSPQTAGPRNAVLGLYLNGGIAIQTINVNANVISGQQLSTSLSLTSNPTRPALGQNVILTATLSPYTASTQNTNGETVTFFNGPNILGSATLSSGVAVYSSSSLPAGNYKVTATYAGDINFAPSISSAVSLAINAITTTTSLSSTAATAIAGTPIAFKATVSPASSPNLLSGTVVFFEGNTTLSIGTVSAGVATFTTSSLAVGVHSITAVYTGSTDNDVFAPSTSSAVSVTITPQVSPSFTIALSPTSASVSRGGYITTALMLTPTGGFNQTVTLTCTGAPANSTCSVSPTSLAPSGNNAAHAMVSLQTTSVTAMRVTQHDSTILAAVLPAGIFVPILFFGGARARRCSFFTLTAIATISLLLTTTGCGGAVQAGASQSPSPETVTLTITATSATITQTATWTVSIQ